ncbi:8918_t:CDS:1, partial [Ambispora gerdemannii]
MPLVIPLLFLSCVLLTIYTESGFHTPERQIHDHSDINLADLHKYSP